MKKKEEKRSSWSKRLDQLELQWSEKTVQKNRKRLQLVTLLGMVLVGGIGFWAYRKGLFTSREVMVAFIESYGILAPLIFILIQFLQCVIPIIPGGLSLVIGVYLFGGFWGFIYNYIGIVLGSVACFILARLFGVVFVRSFVSEATYQKNKARMDRNQKKLRTAFVLTMLLPGFPDDFICMLAGLSDMPFSFFLLHLLWTKVPSILLYSLFLKHALQAGGSIWQKVPFVH